MTETWHGELRDNRELFMLIVVEVSQLYTFVKILHSVHCEWVHLLFKNDAS